MSFAACHQHLNELKALISSPSDVKLPPTPRIQYLCDSLRSIMTTYGAVIPDVNLAQQLGVDTKALKRQLETMISEAEVELSQAVVVPKSSQASLAFLIMRKAVEAQFVLGQLLAALQTLSLYLSAFQFRQQLDAQRPQPFMEFNYLKFLVTLYQVLWQDDILGDVRVLELILTKVNYYYVKNSVALIDFPEEVAYYNQIKVMNLFVKAKLGQIPEFLEGFETHYVDAITDPDLVNVYMVICVLTKPFSQLTYTDDDNFETLSSTQLYQKILEPLAKARFAQVSKVLALSSFQQWYHNLIAPYVAISFDYFYTTVILKMFVLIMNMTARISRKQLENLLGVPGIGELLVQVLGVLQLRGVAYDCETDCFLTSTPASSTDQLQENVALVAAAMLGEAEAMMMKALLVSRAME